MPDNPWEIRTDDSRTEDSIATYIIFCEDENSEPSYFRSFQIEKKLKINTISNQSQGTHNYLNTVSQCVRNGKMEYTEQGYRIKQDVTENIWSVYDRDAETIDHRQLIPKDDIDFTTAIQNAQAAGIKVAWSNDVFELWILLHYRAITKVKRLHRTEIYDQLTEIVKNTEHLSDELLRVTGNELFRYEDHAKKRNNFIQNILPIIKDKTTIAIQNATALEAMYITEPPHDRNPCTMVHHLVQELLAFHNV